MHTTCLSAPTCQPTLRALRHKQIHPSAQRNLCLAVAQRVAEDCGLMGVLPSHWVAPVDGVLPGSGYRITWDGLWAELSPGASLENLAAHGAPPAAPAALLDLLQRRLSQRDVINASVFDLLTSQCDRHAENVYVSAAGQLSLIDNDQAYGSSECAHASIRLKACQWARPRLLKLRPHAARAYCWRVALSAHGCDHSSGCEVRACYRLPEIRLFPAPRPLLSQQQLICRLAPLRRRLHLPAWHPEV